METSRERAVVVPFRAGKATGGLCYEDAAMRASTWSNQTVSWALATLVPCALFVVPLSCGGDDSSNGTPSDASSDAAADSREGVDAARGADGAMAGSDAKQQGDSNAGGQEAAADGGADSSPDADAAVTCPPPADPTKAQVCLVFDTEMVKVESSNKYLDGNGQLLVQ